jgi:hypothetical protein
MATMYSPKVVNDGLVFYYDMGNGKKSWKGRPITNQFAAPTPASNNDVTFSVQGTGTFKRVTSGRYDGYNIKPTDIVYRYDLGGSGCHYHGNDVTITAGQTATFSFDYYISGDAGNYPTVNYLASFEGVVSAAVADPTPSTKGVWKRAVFSATAGSTGLCRMLLYPGACAGSYLASSGFILYKNVQVEFDAPGLAASPFVAGTRFANNNLETSPSYPTWNTAAGSSASGGTLTFSGGSYNSKSSWDLYKTYSGLTAGVSYTWSARVRAGTASSLLVTMNNTQSWDTGPSIVASNLSSTEWRRVTITGTTSSGSFNLHLGASYNVELRDTTQPAGTVFIEDVRLYLTNSDTSIRDITDRSTIIPSSLTYNADGTFSFNGSTDHMVAGAMSGSFAQFTVSVWFNSTSVSNYRNPIDCNFNYNGTTGNIGPRLEQNSSGNLAWTVSGNTGNNSIADGFTVQSSGLLANTWYNAVITWTNGSASTYLNGVPVVVNASTPSGFVNVFNNVVIGKGFHLDAASTRSFIGSIPATQIYNRALSAAEVQQNFQALRGRYGI